MGDTVIKALFWDVGGVLLEKGWPMFSWTRPFPEALALAAELARGGRYLMATLNVEA